MFLTPTLTVRSSQYIVVQSSEKLVLQQLLIPEAVSCIVSSRAKTSSSLKTNYNMTQHKEYENNAKSAAVCRPENTSALTIDHKKVNHHTVMKFTIQRYWATTYYASRSSTFHSTFWSIPVIRNTWLKLTSRVCHEAASKLRTRRTTGTEVQGNIPSSVTTIAM